MTDKDQHRADVLKRLTSKAISTERAAQLLGVTPRQVRRLRHAYDAQGLACLVHGNRGRRPANALSPNQQETIRSLAGPQGPYQGFNLCHVRDMLEERHQIAVGRSTLRRLLRPASALSPKPAPQTRRSRRLRSAAEGEMVQIDGSVHDWLEGRGPRMCLLGAIDDATGKVLSLRFWPTECASGYLFLLRQVATDYGLPMSYYHDKHTILHSPKKSTIEEQLSGTAPMSQIQRVMHELGIESIPAHSPQAKGRIERLWQTLQDRLIKEMRLEGIDTLEAANAFLPGLMRRHNHSFAVEAMDPEPAWVGLDEGFDHDYYFSLTEHRTVKADHTLSYQGQTWQICAASRSRSLAGQSVSIRVNAQDQAFVYDGKRKLQYRVLPGAPARKPAPIPAVTQAPPLKRPKDYKPNAQQRAFLYAKI